MKVYIPTKGRLVQETYDRISPYHRERYGVTLVSQDMDEHDALFHRGYPVALARVEGISATRQWCLDNSPDRYVVMMDDDLTSWAQRVEDKDAGTTRFVKGTDSNILGAGLEMLEKLLDQFAHVGIGHRQFCNNKPVLDHNGRIMRVLGYDRDILAEHNVRFSLPLMEDFEVNLKLLTLGYESANYYGVVQDQRGSNTVGGCSTIRTLALQAAAAEGLAAMFPEVVTIKDADGWDIGTRKDVSVRWKKALGLYGDKEKW